MARPKQLWIALGALTVAGAAGAVAAAGRLRREGSDSADEPEPPTALEPDPADAEPPHPAHRPRRAERTKLGARAYRLGRSEPAGEGLRRIALGRLGHALGQLRRDHGHAEAVHEARKDLKKLRAVLRLLRARVGDELYRRENAGFRDTGRLLSGARDAQVRIDTLDALVASDAVPPPAIAEFRHRLEHERGARAVRDDPEQLAAALIAEASKRARGWPVGGDGWDAVEPGLRRSYRRGRARMKDALAEPSVENLHEWRKRVKDLWYHLRILTPAWPPVLEALAEEAHVLSERLGDDHDLAVLALAAKRHFDAFADPSDLDDLVVAIEQRRAELQSDAFSLGRRLYADAPDAFVLRLEAWWRAWREPPVAGATPDRRM